MSTSYIVTIDPAFRKNGHCVLFFDIKKREVKFVFYKNFAIFAQELFLMTKCFSFLQEYLKETKFVIENSNLQDAVWVGGKSKVNHLSVGKNQAVSQLTCDFVLQLFRSFFDKKDLKDCGINNIIQYSPKEKGMPLFCNNKGDLQKDDGFIIEYYKKTHNLNVCLENSQKINSDALSCLKLLTLYLAKCH